MSNNGENQEQRHPCGVKFCRGTTVGCPNSLVSGQPEIEAIKSVLMEAVAAGAAQQRKGQTGSHHPGLRVALAACPNACTEPQTKDVGIIAIQFPTGVGASCDGCSRCEMVCREDAIRVANGKAQIVPERCVGCGQCIRGCPNDAISSEPLRFRILVGGRMGRHPRWAEQLCIADGPDVVKVVRGFLDEVRRHAGPGERAAKVAERIGVAALREEVAVDVL